MKKAEAGHKASKLLKVEIIISIDAIKVVEQKNKVDSMLNIEENSVNFFLVKLGIFPIYYP